MIIDLERFIAEERPYWGELEQMLDKMERDAAYHLELERAMRLHYLYQRASAGLAKIATFASEPDLRRYLESLMARAYGELHESRARQHRFAPLDWFFVTFPNAFRRRRRAFITSVSITLVGVLFGGLAVAVDPAAKEVILPYPHLSISPAQRVQEEEQHPGDTYKGAHLSGSVFYMTHNTQVSVFVMALGLTWGIGTTLLLFANGVMLGAVALDYVLAGQTRFVAGWLLPHGSVEIPAILLAGQAGLVLAGALIGWGTRDSLRTRLRSISADLITLIFGVAIMLVWAGIVEACFSQFHEPILPYSLKILFGVVELVLLTAFLGWSGRRRANGGDPDRGGARA
ncbi:MAG: stage II sporulation protein M [Candidatus Hydrogenedentes bacterium]|nr:stage II sporulation protein M [Candidatus Hydrogenedentota bacterium]